MFNAVNEQKQRNLYTCAVSLSPTETALAEALGMHYDPHKTSIPTMILAAAEKDVISPDGVRELYDAIDAPKVMALRSDADHGKMLYYGDGYVTAWFLYWLCGQKEAEKVFASENPELIHNRFYQQQHITWPF